MAFRSNKRMNACIEALESRQLMSISWVATNGSDAGNGSEASPWASIQHAIDQAQPGDVVRLRGGVYNQGGISINKPNIKLRSAPGEWAQIVAPIDDPNVQVAVHIGMDASGTILKNIDISGGGYYAVKTDSNWDSGAADQHGASDVLITGAKLHDSGADVVKMTPGTNHMTIENTEIYNSGRRAPDNAEGIDGVQSNYFTLRDSHIHDTTTNGIYLKGGSIGTLIERNTVNATGNSGILLGQSSDENWFDHAADPNYYENIDGIVRNNCVYDTQGAGIGAWAALRPQIYNNTLVNVAQTMFSGLLIQGQEHYVPDSTIIPSTDVSMYNNTVVVNSDRPVLQIRTQGLTGSLDLSNNIYYQGAGRPVLIDDQVGGYTGGLGRWQQLGHDAGSRNADPLLGDGFVPNAGSPAIDAGRATSLGNDFALVARPQGAGIDIGAREVIQ